MTAARRGRERTAGLLLFRRTADEIEVLLAHPGTPFAAKRDLGAWTIPKGSPNPGEDLLACAVREFEEETGFQVFGPFVPLGVITQAAKVLTAWASEGDAEPASLRSNVVRTEFPYGSSAMVEHPEVDRCEWYKLTEAKARLVPAQVALLARLRDCLANPDSA